MAQTTLERLAAKNEWQKKYYVRTREARLAYSRKWKLKNGARVKAYTASYSDRQMALNKANRHADPEKFRSKRRAKYASDPALRAKLCAKTRAYRKANRVKVNAYTNLRNKTNLQAKITRRIRWRIWAALHREGLVKKTSLRELIGCDINFLKNHIEAQFEPWMSWDNYGPSTWHIDHIIACSRFDLRNVFEQRACFHYSNLQPLAAIENCRKGAKLIYG